MRGGACMRAVYMWSNTYIKEKVGLSAGGRLYVGTYTRRNTVLVFRQRNFSLRKIASATSERCEWKAGYTKLGGQRLRPHFLSWKEIICSDKRM